MLPHSETGSILAVDGVCAMREREREEREMTQSESGRLRFDIRKMGGLK